MGVGSLGKHHARIYSELPQSNLVAVIDPVEDRAEEIASRYGCRALKYYRQVFGEVDAVSLAVPTTSHAEIG